MAALSVRREPLCSAKFQQLPYRRTPSDGPISVDEIADMALAAALAPVAGE
jgi:hypothetical protein